MSKYSKEILADFHQSFRQLLQVSNDIIECLEKYGLDSNMNNIKTVSRGLLTYIRCYNKTREDERYFHIDIFKRIYQSHQNSIVADIQQFANWLKSNKIKITFSKESQVVLYISYLFWLSIEIRRIISSKVADEKECANIDEYFYTDMILLFLMKIFRNFAIEDRKKSFLVSISLLEESLGIEDEDNSENLGGGLAGIAKMAVNVMKQNGLGPPGKGDMDTDKMGEAIGNIFGNQDLQSTLGEMFNDLKGTNDIGGVIQTIINKTSDPRFTKALQEQVGKVAQDQPNREKSNVSPSSSDQNNKVVESNRKPSQHQSAEESDQSSRHNENRLSYQNGLSYQNSTEDNNSREVQNPKTSQQIVPVISTNRQKTDNKPPANIQDKTSSSTTTTSSENVIIMSKGSVPVIET